MALVDVWRWVSELEVPAEGLTHDVWGCRVILGRTVVDHLPQLWFELVQECVHGS